MTTLKMKYFFSIIMAFSLQHVYAQKATIEDIIDMYEHRSDIPYFIRRGIALGFEEYGGNLCRTSIDVSHQNGVMTERINLNTDDSVQVSYHTHKEEIYSDWLTWVMEHEFHLVSTPDEIVGGYFHRYAYYESADYRLLIDKFEGDHGMVYIITVRGREKKG
jgi:hypothetical protein